MIVAAVGILAVGAGLAVVHAADALLGGLLLVVAFLAVFDGLTARR